jgi:hypothetical protein
LTVIELIKEKSAFEVTDETGQWKLKLEVFFIRMPSGANISPYWRHT